MEEGELVDPGPFDHAGQHVHHIRSEYSPELEWPGETPTEPTNSYDPLRDHLLALSASDDPQFNRSHLSVPSPETQVETSCLRLLVQRSSILAQKQTLAMLDGYMEVHLGRDVASPGSDTPRIRLKEMEVSKLHATIFWDQDRREWAVVDMGSKHGTYLKPSRESGSPLVIPPPEAHGRGTRLSAPRTASVPRRLAHLDCLTIGGTTFLIHVHDNVPCANCSPTSDNEIPLFHRRSADRVLESKKRKRDGPDGGRIEPDSITPTPRNPKAALNDLRRDLLSRHYGNSKAPVGQTRYTDRSALRRALHPEAPYVPTPCPPYPRDPARDYSPYARSPDLAIPAVSAPPAPLPDSNIGRRLLLKQGWSPGESLGQNGSSDVALVEPLNVKANVGRLGLGGINAELQVGTSTPHDWRAAGQSRRWTEVRTRDAGGPS